MTVYFDRIKKYYGKGYYTKEQVYSLVGKPKGITAEEYKEITGEEYTG